MFIGPKTYLTLNCMSHSENAKRFVIDRIDGTAKDDFVNGGLIKVG